MKPYLQSVRTQNEIWAQQSANGRPDWQWQYKAQSDDMFANPSQGMVCCNCGWPIKCSAMKAGRDPDGNRLYAHPLCPTTKQRAELRRQALANS